MLLFQNTNKTTTAHGYLCKHTPNKSNPRKLNPTQKTPNTAHCIQSARQTAQRAENVVEHTVPDKNRSGALNAMRSTQRETRDTREVERATRDQTETLRTRSRASNARLNGNGHTAKRAKNTQRNETGLWERMGGK